MNIGYRLAIPYLVVCKWISREEISVALPPLIGMVDRWMKMKKIDASGPPFFEYRVMNAGRMHVCVGFPVAEAVAGDDQVHAGAFPEGEYAGTSYFGHYDGLFNAQQQLNEWFTAEGYKQRFLENSDSVFSGSRTEFYVTDPASEPDTSKWRTDIAVWVKRS